MRLVVVGNGMAGVRAIEEILARGGGEKFDITVFGDEPYGNYNRILLSNVLAGKDDPREIYLNALDWYTDNGIDLRAGVRVVRLDTFAHLVHADDGTTMRYDKLVLATGSRAFFPPMDGLWADDKTLADGVFGFRTLDDTAAMIAEACCRCSMACAISPKPRIAARRWFSAAGCWAWRPPAGCRAGAWRSRWYMPVRR